MSSPHDALFKATFSKPENAVAELRLVLPKELVVAIDFSTLTVLGSHFVDDDLEGSESDLLFSVRIDGNEALLYVLIEHQSSVDWSMPLRLLPYMVSAWEQHAREHPAARKVPPIVPVVLHHSAGGWTAAFLLQRTRDNPALDQELAAWVEIARELADDALRLERIS